jgi:prepilin-type N-terminal cleavage/methylation domain-containing protein
MIKFLKQKNRGRKSGGFTLVEVLVAIFIFSLAITALMAALSGGISDTTFAKQKMTATYLAQEGIEYMRNMRDDYVLYPATGLDWIGHSDDTDFVNQIIPCETGNCGFDSSLSPADSDFMVSSSCSTTPSPLNLCEVYVDNNGNYNTNPNHLVGTNSGFLRIITADLHYNSENEAKITSTVYWQYKNTKYNVSFSENLFNWTQ